MSCVFGRDKIKCMRKKKMFKCDREGERSPLSRVGTLNARVLREVQVLLITGAVI